MTRWAGLTWQSSDPPALADDLGRRLGVPARDHRELAGAFTIELGTVELELTRWQREAPGDEPRPAGRLVLEPIDGGADDRRVLEPPPLVLVAVGWATVDLDRAEAELKTWLGAPRPDPDEDGTEPHLGARTRVRAAPGLPGDALVLSEPTTEGRLAAALARDGEGPYALYLRPRERLDDWLRAARARQVTVSAALGGPFGPSVLAPGRQAAGPHVVLVAGRGPPSARRLAGYYRGVNDTAQATLRAATPDDAERLANLLTDEGYPAGASDLAARIGRFSTPRSRVVVAEAAGEVVGFIAFHVIDRFEVDERFVRIVALVVDPGVRERGVGRHLMAEAERVAIEEGAAYLEITAGHHRPEARQLYESLGYDAGVAAYLRKRP